MYIHTYFSHAVNINVVFSLFLPFSLFLFCLSFPFPPHLPPSSCCCLPLSLHTPQEYLLRTEGPVALSDIMNIKGHSLTSHPPVLSPATEATHSHAKDSAPSAVGQEGKLVLLSTSSSTELTQGFAHLGGVEVRMDHFSLYCLRTYVSLSPLLVSNHFSWSPF